MLYRLTPIAIRIQRCEALTTIRADVEMYPATDPSKRQVEVRRF